MPEKSANPPRFPAKYGEYLEQQAKSINLDRNEIAKLADLDYQTVYRNFTGKPQRSVLAANKIRRVLVDRGLDIAPVPGSEDESWEPPSNAPSSQLSPAAEIFRRNLSRFRIELGLSLHEAAQATGIAVDVLERYELGDGEPSGREMLRIQDVYDRPGAHFEMATPPPRERKPKFIIHAGSVGAMEDLPPDERAAAEAILRGVREFNERQREEARRIEEQRAKIRKSRKS